MGVLPLQFAEGTNARSLKLDGSEMFSVIGLSDVIRPRQKVRFRIKRKDGQTEEIDAILRIDTPIEVDYYRHGGIVPDVLRGLLSRAGGGAPATPVFGSRDLPVRPSPGSTRDSPVADGQNPGHLH